MTPEKPSVKLEEDGPSSPVEAGEAEVLESPGTPLQDEFAAEPQTPLNDEASFPASPDSPIKDNEAVRPATPVLDEEIEAVSLSNSCPGTPVCDEIAEPGTPVKDEPMIWN